MQYINRKGGIGSLHRFMTVEENVEQYLQSPENTFCSLGLNDQKRFEELYMAGCRRYMLDLAHGHSSMMSDALKWLKNKANDIVIVAGNVCTADGAAFLVDQGADIVKVGVGPGSVCTTRDKTGHGYPQLSAVMECSSAIPNNSVIADGGLKHPGDIVKALAAGADFVMLGSCLLVVTTHQVGFPPLIFWRIKHTVGWLQKMYTKSILRLATTNAPRVLV